MLEQRVATPLFSLLVQGLAWLHTPSWGHWVTIGTGSKVGETTSGLSTTKDYYTVAMIIAYSDILLEVVSAGTEKEEEKLREETGWDEDTAGVTGRMFEGVGDGREVASGVSVATVELGIDSRPVVASGVTE